MKFLHKLYANFFGFFWLPCPKCGEMFGGHQVAVGGAHVIVTEGDATRCYCVCPACDTAELRAENAAAQQRQMGEWLQAMTALGNLKIEPRPQSELRVWVGQGNPFRAP